MNAITQSTWWPWLALPALVIVAWLGGLLLSRLSRAVLHRLTARTPTTWDDALLAGLAGPLTLAWALALIHVGLPWLELAPKVESGARRGAHVVLLIIVFWAVWSVVDVASKLVADMRWSTDHAASRALVPLGRRLSKVAVVLAAIVTLLSELGYSVTSLVAGLGIGGLAVALAARSTLENLFGAFSIGADQPFREGDTIKVEDVVGIVEAVGLRSTRIRTADRTLVTMPNGKLADTRVESYSARDRLRFACVLRLLQGTTAAQLRQVLAGVEAVLREQPRLWPDNVSVRLTELGAFSLNVEVTAWFRATDDELAVVRQDLLLRFLDVIERAGSALALPTQTVHVAPTK
jgi:MscS family membrane protein